jgi:Ca-activated chloride channel family protein
LITKAAAASEMAVAHAGDFAFATAVAEFGSILRDSPFKGTASYEHVLASARSALGQDRFGYREEFMRLVAAAQQLDRRSPTDAEEPSGGIQFKAP